MMNITADFLFLFYAIVNEQYPIMGNCFASVITLESALLYMKNKLGNEKKFKWD